MKRTLLGLILLLASAVGAHAANRFAVCTVTCTWDNSSTAMWSATSGGGTGASVPGTSDAVILDAATCVGGVTCTITVNTTVAVQSITMGACTASTTGCILDFSANNNNVTVTATLGMGISGSGTRTINMGSGTFTLSGNGGSVWDMATVTNLTLNAGGSTVLFSGTGNQGFSFGTKSMNIVTIGSRTGMLHVTDNSGAHTVATLNIIAPNTFYPAQNVTTTITNAMNFVGTQLQPIFIKIPDPSSAVIVSTISSASTSTCTWCAIRNITFTGAGTFTANNSFNLQDNIGITFNGPSPFGGSGGCILGGWLLWRDLPNYINDNFPAWLEKAA